jgi:hypothetical protein
LQPIKDHIPSFQFLRLFVVFVALLGLVNDQVQSQEVKCGTPHYLEMKHKGIPVPLAGVPPSLMDSIRSESGKFTVHFDTSGENRTGRDFALKIAAYADDAFEFEINDLGYEKPPYSYSDSSWHIYLIPLGTTIYGRTEEITGGTVGISPTGLPLVRSFMVINNSFDGTPTKGDDAAKITVFHEFHHVVQFGSYGVNYAELKIHEMTSVWMEMRSNPDIPDYLFYLPSYLSTINKSFKSAGDVGYSQGIWLQFLEKRYGDEIVKQLWEHYRDVNKVLLSAMDSILVLRSSSFCNEYKRFGAELFFTGRRYRGSSIFPDAALIPVESLKYNLQDTGKTYVYDLLSEASLNLYAAGIGSDTAVVSVSRSPKLIFSSDTITIFDLSSYRATYQFPETFCDTIVGGKQSNAEVFPMPFVISSDKNETVKIFAKDKLPSTDTRLGIYTVDMKLVRYFEGVPSPVSGRYYMQWDGKDDVGKYVSSGVYIYSVEVDGERRIGKIVVVRK